MKEEDAPKPLPDAPAPQLPPSVSSNMETSRRIAASNVQRATQRRRDAWHRGYFSMRPMLAIVLFAASQVSADFHSPLDDASAVQKQLREAISRSSHSVYAVTAFTSASPDPALFAGRVAGPMLAAIAEPRERSCGSAFAISADGHLITNEHVVSGAASVWVTDDAGRVLPAIVVGTDPRSDLAVLFIPSATQPLTIAKDSPDRGDFVTTLGNPDGLATEGELSASVGIVSATHRALASLSTRERRNYGDLIQVTTPIAIGGSGGPLIDLDGKVLGIVCAVATADRDGMPVGFAIALSPPVLDRIEKLARGEEIIHPYFGVSVSVAVDAADLAGVRIDRIEPSAPAEGVLREGDIVLSVEGERVTTDRRFIDLAASCRVDADVRLTVRRESAVMNLVLRPGRRALPAEPVTRATQRFTWAGVTFENAEGGVRVAGVDSTASMPLAVGAVVRGINGTPVPDVVALARVLTDSIGQPLTLDADAAAK